MKRLEPGTNGQPVTEAAAGPALVSVSPTRRVASAGADWVRADLSGLQGVAQRTRPRAARAVRAGRMAGRTAVRPTARAIAGKAVDGLPNVDTIADRGANAIARAAARILTGTGWFSGSGWARLAKYRTKWDP